MGVSATNKLLAMRYLFDWIPGQARYYDKCRSGPERHEVSPTRHTGLDPGPNTAMPPSCRHVSVPAFHCLHSVIKPIPVASKRASRAKTAIRVSRYTDFFGHVGGRCICRGGATGWRILLRGCCGCGIRWLGSLRCLPGTGWWHKSFASQLFVTSLQGYGIRRMLQTLL